MNVERVIAVLVLLWLAGILLVSASRCAELPVPDVKVNKLGCDCTEHVAEPGIIGSWQVHAWATDADGKKWIRLLAMFPTENDKKARAKALMECDKWLGYMARVLKRRAGPKQ